MASVTQSLGTVIAKPWVMFAIRMANAAPKFAIRTWEGAQIVSARQKHKVVVGTQIVV